MKCVVSTFLVSLVVFPLSASSLSQFPDLSVPFTLSPAPSRPPSGIDEIEEMIRKAAFKHNVPEALVKSIVAAESNFAWDVISPKGAIGLMQLMPDTAKEYGADPLDPWQNVDAGTHYLRFLLDKYQHHRNSLSRAVAAYNAGPAMVDRYHGIPPFRETRQYVVRVMRFLLRFRKVPAESGT